MYMIPPATTKAPLVVVVDAVVDAMEATPT